MKHRASFTSKIELSCLFVSSFSPSSKYLLVRFEEPANSAKFTETKPSYNKKKITTCCRFEPRGIQIILLLYMYIYI